MSDKYLTVIRKWDFCGEDTVFDNDTSGKAARSEKMVNTNEAVTRQLLQDFWIKVDEKE